MLAPDALQDRIVVVAGATRGAGRGIALAFGEAGATVICTGRTSRTGRLTSDYPERTETIEETAEIVTGLGGHGIAEIVDHLDIEQVTALAERIASRHGHIDVLVNDIWGGELLHGGPASWNRPIWDHDLDAGLRMLRLGVETHLVTAHRLLPLVAAASGGLVVEMTDGTAAYNATTYRISVFYDLVKTAVSRLAFSLGHELGTRGATAVAVTPGWLRSEMMLEHFGTTEPSWREALDPQRAEHGLPVAPPDFAQSETPRYVGRGLAAMASDPDRHRWNQQTVTSGQLALTYGVTDTDGSQPDIWPSIEALPKG